MKTRSLPEVAPGSVARHLGQLRVKAMTDFLFFAREILGYDLIDYDLPLHQEMAKQATARCNTLTLVPRGFIKSTLITVSGSVWHALQHPEECTLLASWTLANAKKFLAEIAGHFVRNEKLRTLFPEACPQKWDEEGTQESFTNPCRKRPRKEATLEVCGADQTVTSRHFEKINVDDAVVKENVPPWATDETQQKVIEWFRSLRAVLRTVAEIYYTTVLGTRWHDGDLYGWLLRQEDLMAYYRVFISKPWDSEGNPVWPAVFGSEKLARMKSEMREYMWACLMMQNPLPPESAIRFDPAWFHTYEGEPPQGTTALTVDPAFSEANTNADRSALAVTTIPAQDGLYLNALMAGRWTPHALVEKIVGLWRQYHPQWVGVEVDGGGKVIYDLLARVRQDFGLSGMVLKQIKSKGKPKAARIAELSGYVEQHGLWYKPHMAPLLEEVLRYPVAEHDDIPDVLASRVLRIDRGPAKVPVKLKGPKTVYVTNTITGREIIDRLTPSGPSLRRVR